MTSFAMTELQRRWMIRLGYPALALFVFVMALHFTFPYERVSDQLLGWMRKHYDVTGAETHAGILPGSFKLTNVNIRTRPASEEEKATEITIDELAVDLGLFAAMRKKLDVEVDIEVGDGELEADMVRSLKNGELEFSARATSLPMQIFEAFLTKVTGGAPINGTLDMTGELGVPDGQWKKAGGKFELTCTDCTFGGKGTKLRPMNTTQQNAFSSAGLTLPRALKLGACTGELAIKDGKGKLKFNAKSDHGELRIEAEITFMDPVARSTVEGFIKYRFSDKLIAEDVKLEAMNSSAMAARLPDGFTGVRVFGEVSGLRFKLSRVNPLEKGGGDSGAGAADNAPPMGANPSRPTAMPVPAVPPPPEPAVEETMPATPPPPEDPSMAQPSGEPMVPPGGAVKGFEPTRPIVRPELLEGAGRARVLPPAGEENMAPAPVPVPAPEEYQRPPDDVSNQPPPPPPDPNVEYR